MLENILILMNQAINFIVQIILFSVVPLSWYIISRRKCRGFGEYIGIQRVEKNSYIGALGITGLVYIFSVLVIMILKITQGGMVSNPLINIYHKGGIVFIISLILFGVQTGISEEILFRGFIGKRLIKRYGFLRGNILQSLIFMFPHIMTFGKASLLECILGMINASIMGFAFGYIMEKKSEGSIIPIIVCHAVVNMTSVLIVNIL